MKELTKKMFKKKEIHHYLEESDADYWKRVSLAKDTFIQEQDTVISSLREYIKDNTLDRVYYTTLHVQKDGRVNLSTALHLYKECHTIADKDVYYIDGSVVKHLKVCSFCEAMYQKKCEQEGLDIA